MKFEKLKKSSIIYLIVFLALSVIQLMLIHGLFSAEHPPITQAELYVDGTDFSIVSALLSGAQSGIYSIVDFISIVVDVILGAVLSLIVMRILRRLTLRSSTIQSKKTGLIITLLCGLIFFLFGSIFMNFKLMLVYIPVPVVSFLSYHLGKKTQNKENTEQINQNT